MSELQVHT